MLFVDDRALLDAFRRGERRALEAVYATYAPAVAGFLRAGFSFQSGGKQCRFRGARSELDLEDRLHDVFARAFGEGARLAYDGLSPYKVYLFTIARNAVIDDFRRKEHALVEYTIEERAEPAAAASPAGLDPITGAVEASGAPDADAEAAELARLVRAFRDGLPEREREIYRLRFERELEHADIARATGLSASKIKTSEGRIRASFFDFMRRHGYFNGYTSGRGGWLRALALRS